MKTKTFLLMCLLLGIGLTQISAQNVANPTPPDNKKQTGNEVFWNEWPQYYIPVVASTGEEIDLLVGSVTCHYIRHYRNGIWVTERVRFSGEVVSVGNDEHFQLNDHWTTLTPYFGGTGHLIAKGESGTVYIMFYGFDADWNFFITKAIKG